MPQTSGSPPQAPRGFDQPIYVTRPLLPDLSTFEEALRGIWQRQWLTNKGPLHDALEVALRDRLRATNVSLVGSGTAALLLAYRALGLTGEVITTPFTFPATVSTLVWAGLTPVFADIDPTELTLDPDAVERAITSRTSAIVGVHVYGMPCQVERLRTIAERHDLRLVYDGAHTFGTEIDGEPIARHGDATTLSFHATKLFNTAEGGAVVTADPDLKRGIDLLKNIGIADEVTVPVAGINARMNEISAALGLACLDLIDAERSARAKIARIYLARLAGIEGLTCFTIPPRVRDSHAYFIVLIDEARAPVTRDQLCERLKTFNVFARRYFHPICSNLPFCRDLPSAAPANLPEASRAAAKVVSLPLYGALGGDGAHRVADILCHILTT